MSAGGRVSVVGAGSAVAGRRHRARSTSADLELFCQREYPRLVAALDLICGDVHVAEDLAQETLVRVWDRWRTVRELESPGGWAYRVALNLARSHVRRRGAESRANRRHGADELRTVDLEIQDDELRTALLALPSREREVVVLRFYLQHSVAETAAVLDIPEGTVKSVTARALAGLRGVVGPDVWDGRSDGG